MKQKLSSIIILLCLVFSIFSCNKDKNQYFHQWGGIFHTFYNIKYESSDNNLALIEESFERINIAANPFNKSSLLYAVNNNLPQWQDSLLLEILGRAIEICKATDGYYDVTVGPFVNIWGFGYQKTPYRGDVPKRVLDSIAEFVGYQKFCIDADTIAKSDPRISIDLASIAKGYTCDFIGHKLEDKGVKNYLVDIGGEIAFLGKSETGENWVLGINKPILDTLGVHSGELEAILELPERGGVATSGNYRNYKVSTSGRIYAHTIDPIQGCPVQSDILSATILADDCMTADALATATMVMGSDKAMKFLERFPGVEAAFMVSDDSEKGYHLITTKGMMQYLHNP